MRTYRIAGKEVTVQKSSFSINDRLNERTTTAFVVVNPSFEIDVGMEFEIEESMEIIARGSIDNVTQSGDHIIYVQVSGVDFSQLTDKRVIADSFEKTLSGDIVRSFIQKTFSQEGITEGNIQSGPEIEKAVFNYEDGNATMNYLQEVTGYNWEVDNNKKLHFFDRSTNTAPFSLSDTSSNYTGLSVKKTRGKYRNRQYLRAGQDVTDVQTERFKGDGEQRTFAVGFKIAKVPTVKVNGVIQSVGIRGLDDGKQFYWSKGEKELTQDDSETKLTDTDIVEINYQGFFPIKVVIDNSSGISDRKKVEGGSGIYEHIAQEENIDTQAAAMQFATGKLEKLGTIPKVVTFNTHVKGLKSGQLLPIKNIKHNLDDKFLIESVTARDDNGLTVYSVKCLDGSAIGGWEKLFKSLLKGNKKLVIRENEVLVKLKSVRDTVAAKDTLIISKAAPESRIGYAMIGFSEVG
jgi:hypothetical protein